MNYGLNGLSCFVYYRREMLHSARTFLTMGLLPFVGFLLFLHIFRRSVRDFTLSGVEDTTYWFGVQAPLVIFLGLMLLGLILIFALRLSSGRGLFRRKLETALPGGAQVAATTASGR
jgi:hypothetical protein